MFVKQFGFTDFLTTVSTDSK